MIWTFTRFGLINALISLIPIFPVWTLFPGIFFAMSLEKAVHSCESSFRIVMWSAFSLAIVLVLFYTIILHKIKSERSKRLNFRLASLFLYLLVNTFALIAMLGTNLACHGDGQAILLCIYSGPIASISLIAFGIILDIKTTIANSR